MRNAGSQHLGDCCRIACEIAGLVHHADEILADQAVGGIGNGKHQLLGQMFGERRFTRQRCADVKTLLIERQRARRLERRPA